MNHKTVHVAIVLAFATVIGACSKGPQSSTPTASAPSTSAPSVSDALSPQAVQQAAAAAKTANLPKPDFNTADSAYVPLTKGTQLMYFYAAFSGMPVDYNSMASTISQDYRMTSDEFKKHDILAALKPKIDAGIADAKAHPYIILTDNNPGIGHYDFQRKAFPVGDALFQQGGYERFYDDTNTELSVTNGALFQNLNVPDENLAKTIESEISSSANLYLKVYAFVQSTDNTSGDMVQAMITKVQLIGPNGQVLLQEVAPH